jgi:hypothetical protein
MCWHTSIPWCEILQTAYILQSRQQQIDSEAATALLRVTHTLECAATAPVMESSIEGATLNYSIYLRTVYSSSKNRYISRFGSYHEVPRIDRAFDASGLIHAFKVALDSATFLLEIEIFRRRGTVGIVAVQRPLSCHSCGGLFRRRLL